MGADELRLKMPGVSGRTSAADLIQSLEAYATRPLQQHAQFLDSLAGVLFPERQIPDGALVALAYYQTTHAVSPWDEHLLSLFAAAVFTLASRTAAHVLRPISRVVDPEHITAEVGKFVMQQACPRADVWARPKEGKTPSSYIFVMARNKTRDLRRKFDQRLLADAQSIENGEDATASLGAEEALDPESETIRRDLLARIAKRFTHRECMIMAREVTLQGMVVRGWAKNTTAAYRLREGLLEKARQVIGQKNGEEQP